MNTLSWRLLEVKNIDSDIDLSRATPSRAVDLPWTMLWATRIPIYLVRPETMDHVCPPERRVGLPSEASREVRGLIDRALRSDSPREFAERVDEVFEGIRRMSRPIAAMGVFIAPEGARTIHHELEVELPAILICPERISKLAEKVHGELDADYGDVFNSLSWSIVLHEQTHATAWTLSEGASYSKYVEPYARIIEECIAQHSSYTACPLKDRALYKQAILHSSRHQPIEYQTWRALASISTEPSTAFQSLYSYANLLLPRNITLIAYPLLPMPAVIVPRGYHDNVVELTLHWLYLTLGPHWHRFYHDVIEPIIARKPDNILKLIALTLLHTHLKGEA